MHETQQLFPPFTAHLCPAGRAAASSTVAAAAPDAVHCCAGRDDELLLQRGDRRRRPPPPAADPADQITMRSALRKSKSSSGSLG